MLYEVITGKTLFLVNALKLAEQAKNTFAKIWPEATLGEYTGNIKIKTHAKTFLFWHEFLSCTMRNNFV